MMRSATSNFMPERVIGLRQKSQARAPMLLGAGLLAIVMGLRLMVGGGGGAVAVQGATTAPMRPAISSVAAADTQPTQFDSALQRWAQQPNPPLKRNPFRIPFRYYPCDESAQSASPAPMDSYWDLVEKSGSAQADQQEQREEVIDNVQRSAESLKLQSIILGASPAAIINGRQLREGDAVDEFRVLRIEARQVIVEREGVRLALQMN